MAKAASLTDFTNFHGMLASPAASLRCIAAFKGAAVIFMPSNYKLKGISAYNYTNLTLTLYYSLVVFSFTGLSTLLGLTHFVRAEEALEKGVQGADTLVTPDIIAFLQASPRLSGVVGELKVVRWFEYRFVVPGVKVHMFHVADSRLAEGKVHLVEIFDKDTLIPYIYAAIAACAAWMWFA
ncbi:hypothetical protein CcCBS67573_g01187 [Chytriomyces confervae]|uniref:Uncharacterized protein n=1 Tax=Chytriomyces confervae TaxID=246404 RepID=A0A507FMA3_9FUNG|nr:hypothetical protein HDU80_000309 [Chytriomyces hyalinus]TPX77551.1 hypothetical protein CcCBS67573_g01187 [Chytriomyces confervae]